MASFSDQQLQAFYRYTVALTADRDLAWDILQSAMLKYLKINGKKPKKPNAYFRQIIKNTFLDHHRNRFNQSLALPEDLPNTSLFNNPEQGEITRSQVANLMKQLNAQERELLYLWAVEGYSFSELAKKLECPRGTLLARIHRLKLRLKPPVEG